jgi:alanine racemase
MTCPPAVPARWAWAEIDLDALAHNVGVLRRAVAPSAVWAVVKADAYGHGATAVATAAIAAGCEGLCVALTAEGVALRAAGIDAPILLLSEQPAEHAATIIANDLTPTVTTAAGIEALAASAPDAPQSTELGVHVKIDTGMHRIGAAPAEVGALVALIAERAPRLRLAGVFTHLAVADEPTNPYTAAQLQCFADTLAALPEGSLDGVALHAANSAGGLAHPGARQSFVRAGIALYGISPGRGIDALVTELRPVLALKARVSFVKRLAAGERLSYGLRHTVPVDTNVATVPLGYADGARRGLSSNGDVLIGGRRRPIIGTVTMDQLMVDCGDDPVERGDEVVLIGEQGADRITAEEWGERLDTIGYEVVCGIGARVPRLLVGGPRHP